MRCSELRRVRLPISCLLEYTSIRLGEFALSESRLRDLKDMQHYYYHSCVTIEYGFCIR